MARPIYAIGDVHGQKAMLDRALSLIETDGGPEAQVVFLGDYTDRGPDSRGVVQTLIEGIAAGRDWICLKGNHDRLLPNYVRGGREQDDRYKQVGISWLNPRLGGAATLASYGVHGQMHFKPHIEGYPERLKHAERAGALIAPAILHSEAMKAVPKEHLTFLETRPLWHQTNDLLFVHAGLRPGVPLADQTEDDLVWIREPFLSSDQDFGRLIVHGHTALDHPQHFGNRVDLDGGAGYGNPLIPAVFEGRDCWLLTDTGRVPLLPANQIG